MCVCRHRWRFGRSLSELGSRNSTQVGRLEWQAFLYPELFCHPSPHHSTHMHSNTPFLLLLFVCLLLFVFETCMDDIWYPQISRPLCLHGDDVLFREGGTCFWMFMCVGVSSHLCAWCWRRAKEDMESCRAAVSSLLFPWDKITHIALAVLELSMQTRVASDA